VVYLTKKEKKCTIALTNIKYKNMKKLIIICILLISICTSKAQTRTADEAAIEKTWARFGNSWRNKDFSDMKDYMTPDCHWINVVGMHWHNLKEVQFAHQAFINAFLKMRVRLTKAVS
jgi:hypothetical protein